MTNVVAVIIVTKHAGDDCGERAKCIVLYVCTYAS